MAMALGSAAIFAARAGPQRGWKRCGVVRRCRSGAFGDHALCLFDRELAASEDEVSALMGLLKPSSSTTSKSSPRNIRLKHRRLQGLAPDIVALIEGALQRTAGNTGLTMAVALNYGSQDEIARAACRCRQGRSRLRRSPPNSTRQTCPA
jgi:undecaprenyl diphosphate synthase